MCLPQYHFLKIYHFLIELSSQFHRKAIDNKCKDAFSNLHFYSIDLCGYIYVNIEYCIVLSIIAFTMITNKKIRVIFFHLFVFIFFTGIWTQGFVLAR
jgi:hypothetical protein